MGALVPEDEQSISGGRIVKRFCLPRGCRHEKNAWSFVTLKCSALRYAVEIESEFYWAKNFHGEVFTKRRIYREEFT